MTTLIVGASGATGRLLVEQLLNRGASVRIIVREKTNLPEALNSHEKLSIIRASVLDLSDAEMAAQVAGCNAVASCLGHRAVFGPPRRLVTEATRRLCAAIETNQPEEPVKFVLMNTAGFVNEDAAEHVSFVHRLVLWLVRLLLPPQPDNEQAAKFLCTEIGKNNKAVEWSVVRPDTLIDETEVTAYEVYPSPTRSAIFNPGKTSRINVGHFMAELITNNDTWSQWKGQMPVIYNKQGAS
ncbi:MAG: SDR family oxidoreductase [Anaerolineae bacterium]|nr:SDR family oxidoreductase [Anaerolineae bacterium]